MLAELGRLGLLLQNIVCIVCGVVSTYNKSKNAREVSPLHLTKQMKIFMKMQMIVFLWTMV